MSIPGSRPSPAFLRRITLTVIKSRTTFAEIQLLLAKQIAGRLMPCQKEAIVGGGNQGEKIRNRMERIEKFEPMKEIRERVHNL